jgi:hypothetical protein
MQTGHGSIETLSSFSSGSLQLRRFASAGDPTIVEKRTKKVRCPSSEESAFPCSAV